MYENVVKFFDIYNNDPSLRQRIKDAEDMYPGSLEIRDAVVQAILLPVAEEMGLPFTLRDLRAYEAKMSVQRCPDEEMTPEELENDEEYTYFFTGRGWSYDTNLFKED